jgi:hypothetical protein
LSHRREEILEMPDARLLVFIKVLFRSSLASPCPQRRSSSRFAMSLRRVTRHGRIEG